MASEHPPTKEQLEQTTRKTKLQISSKLKEQVDELIGGSTTIEPTVMTTKQPSLVCNDTRCKHTLLNHCTVYIKGRPVMIRCQVCDTTCVVYEEALYSGYMSVAREQLDKLLDEAFDRQG